MPRLAALATDSAFYRHSQRDVLAAVQVWLREIRAEVDPRAVERLFLRAGVSERSSLQPLAEVFRDIPFAIRNETYRAAMISAGVKLSERALASSSVRTVDAIVSSSCTGFMIPAVDAFVAHELRLGPWLTRLPITEAGCAGGAVALARSADFLAAKPQNAALVLAVEYSSLTFQAREPSATNLVATALFADGAASAVLIGDEHPDAGAAPIELVACASYFLRDSLGAMGYDVVDSGLRLVLDKRLPDFLRGRLREIVRSFLDAQGTDLEGMSAFAIHPGGRKVLDVAQEELRLDDQAMSASRSVLAEHGNMSSATILFVLERALRSLPPGGYAVGIGFGPGFAVELSLWRRDLEMRQSSLPTQRP